MTVVDPAATPPAAPGPEGEATPAAPEGTEVDPFAPLADVEPDAFPKDYVTKIRQSGAKYRTERNDLRTQLEAAQADAGAFEGWEPEQVEGWKTFLGTAQENPSGALHALITDAFGMDKEGATAFLTEMFGEGEAPGAQTPPEGADGADRPVTLKDLEAREAAQAQERQAQADLQSVRDEAKALGYEPGKPGSPEEFLSQRLFYIAANVTGGDLNKAHEALVAEKQQIAHDALASMAEQANGLPVPAGNGTAGAAVNTESKTFAQADEAARQALAARS